MINDNCFSSSLRCKRISLGRGQDAIAAKLLSEAMVQGNWIILENCHLAISWTHHLEILYNNLRDSDSIHEDFRLLCITKPVSKFPITLLRHGSIVACNPPKNFKEKVLTQLDLEPLNNDKYFKGTFSASTQTYWLRQIFALITLHAVIQERRLFGPIGWNFPYLFDDQILKQCIGQLRIFLKQSASIKFDSLVYLISECNYGGEVIDGRDRRLLHSLSKQFCNNLILQNETYTFFEKGNHFIPPDLGSENFVSKITEWPIILKSNDVGLHPNADFFKNANEGNYVCKKFMFFTSFFFFCFHL